MIGMERIKDCKVGQISWWFHLVLTRLKLSRALNSYLQTCLLDHYGVSIIKFLHHLGLW